MKILITGASGFIGGEFFKYLKENTTHKVLGLGRRECKYKDSYVVQDLLTPIKKEILDFKPEVIVHCAALSSPWGSENEYEKLNIKATENIINFANEVGAKLIHISTGAIFYKKENQYNIKEDEEPPKELINTYARTKLIAENLVKERSKNYVILRPRAVFGEHDTVIFPRIMKANKIPAPKKWVVKSDVLYIDNMNYYLIKSCEEKINGVFNINNQEEVNMHSFIEDILNKIEKPFNVIYINPRLLMVIAKLVENMYKMFNIKKEPILTEFGVCALCYSKTFDYTKTKKVFGSPPFDNDKSIKKYTAWLKKNNK